MKILVQTSDGVVFYAANDMVLSEDGVSGDGWRDPQFTTANSTIEEATLPDNWSGGVWSYDGSTWSVHDTPAHDALVESARIATIPAVVSPRQIRQALTAAGLRSAVEAAVAAGDQDTKDWYEFSTAIERAHPMVVAMGVGLGVTTEQLDDLFIAAGAL